MASGSAKTSGIITRVYKSGSIIYFAGDRSENIYILKSGHVVLTSTKPDTGAEVKEEVRKGEFFGVKSALGKYPREETAQTVGETVVLIMGLADFERLILRNVDVVRKMLRVFSNQLRRIGKMVRSVLGEGENLNPDVELFRIGEHYYKAGVFQQSQYAFKKYMEYYPDGEYASVAMERIRAIDSGVAEPGDTGFTIETKPSAGPVAAEAAPDNGSGFDELDDFTGGDEPETGDFADSGSDSAGFFDSSATGSSSDLTSEMDDFLSDDSLSDGLDDFFDEPDSESGGSKIRSMYEEGAGHFSGEEYESALEIFKKIVESGENYTGEDAELYENAYLEMGRCYMKLKKNKSAIDVFSSFIKKFPKSGNIKKSLFYIANIFESANQPGKAVAYYKKIVSMKPADSIGEEAALKLKQLQSEQV